ncbi:hypothetical protein [Fervidibacillus albus]|uniref:Uncharacterized protein n=1 Tax=Fervidibacillus albus TaxID=2980026 RepID=A0A9E8LVP7_9BACI|nr:hypothetical protein [Fervidibacillus albus]WAA09971.1 hypothetical protein OE104_00925 [Fervidibacillus albus]
MIISSQSPFTNLVKAKSDHTTQAVELSEGVLPTNQLDDIYTDVELDKNVLEDDFNLEEVSDITTIQKMDKEKKELFYQIVEEQVAMSGLKTEEGQKMFKQSLVDFFDETSDTYGDLTAAQNKIEIELDEILEQENSFIIEPIEPLIETSDMVTVNPSFLKGNIKIGVKFAAAIFNTIIGIIVGGGVYKVQTYIIKVGEKEAQRIFYKTIGSRLKAWGAKKLAIALGAIITFAMNYLDMGTVIAKELEKRDKKPNNGYIEIY